MTTKDIHSVVVSDTIPFSTCLMDEEIRGTTVYSHGLKSGEVLYLPEPGNAVRIVYLSYGSFEALSDGIRTELSGSAVYIGKEAQKLTISAISDCKFIEIIRKLTADEVKSITAGVLPYALAYEKAAKYTEDCKSAKTVSRMLVPARIIPRFAMGSVETEGDDLIEKHTHPLLEQFFYGLPGNDCSVLVDDISVHFGENTLLHIPLGSDHGVVSHGKEKVKYLWMDFLFNEESLKYMDVAHQIIDE